MSDRKCRRLATAAVFILVFILGTSGCSSPKVLNAKVTKANFDKIKAKAIDSPSGMKQAEIETILGKGTDIKEVPGGGSTEPGLKWKKWEHTEKGNFIAIGFGGDGKAESVVGEFKR